ncbi:serpin family protein [candidate division WOR-3 bacterium]|nr:serpin family protein [candidate division WOR-3 bacterium]
MKSKGILFLFIVILLSTFGCDTTEPTEPLRELSSSETKIVESDNSFGLKLFKEINAGEEKNLNVFISPLSISMALGMTYNGAAGSTEEAMRTTLEFGDLSMGEINESYKSLIGLLRGIDSEVEFSIANSIWYRDDWIFEQDFFERCRDYFDARVSGLDFSQNEAAKDTMNNWVDENTNGKIEETVDYVNPIYDVMFLINAIYFNGTWTYQFNEEDTKDTLFYLSGGSTEECKMMEVKSKFKYFEDSLLQAIDIPYGIGNYSMTVILPGYGKDMDQFIAELTQEKWDEWMSRFSEDSVNLFLPKLKVEYKADSVLKEVLKDMGMEIAFDGRADFTQMHKPGGIWIGKVIHKTFLEVDEEGTEAAAATVVEMIWESTGGGEVFPVMRINRPFLFAIRENHSGTILFIGKIIDPVWE